MASEFTGTSTEKIDKLIQAVVAIRTTLRNIAWFVGLGLPLVLGMLAASWATMSKQMNETQVRVGNLDGKLSNVDQPVRAAANEVKQAGSELQGTINGLKGSVGAVTADVKAAGARLQNAATKFESAAAKLEAVADRLDSRPPHGEGVRPRHVV